MFCSVGRDVGAEVGNVVGNGEGAKFGESDNVGSAVILGAREGCVGVEVLDEGA